jgi:hypothetical protein
MLTQSPQIDQLARQRVAELHDAARLRRLAARSPRQSRTLVGRLLVGLGTLLAPAEVRATNRMRKLAGR